MPLATRDDVKRVLGIPDADTSLDDAIDASLEAADEYVRRKLRRTYSSSTPTTEKFFNSSYSGTVFLAEEAASITSVVDRYAATLTFEFDGGNQVRLTESSDPIGDPRVYTPGGPAEDRFSVVTVTYVPRTTVPTPVREAVALIAAEFTPDAVTRDSNGQVVGRIIQEKIGDYGYMVETDSLKAGVKGDRIKKALWLLRPYFRRRVYVV